MQHASDFRREVGADRCDTPDWVGSIIAACAALTGATLNSVSSIDVSGIAGGTEGDRRRLFNLVERLAEEYDLDVMLNIEGKHFSARFSTVEPRNWGTHA